MGVLKLQFVHEAIGIVASYDFVSSMICVSIEILVKRFLLLGVESNLLCVIIIITPSLPKPS